MKRAIPTLVCLTLLVGTTCYSTTQGAEIDTNKYANALLGSSHVHTINIQINKDNWADLLENPTEKTKYKSTIVIDGNTIENGDGYTGSMLHTICFMKKTETSPCFHGTIILPLVDSI